MAPRRRRVLAASLGVLLVLALLAAAFVGVVSWRSAESLVHPDRPSFSYAPDDFGLAYEAVALETEDGLRLAGWWMPADGEAKGTVVFLHGYGDSKNQSLAYATFLHNASWHVLAFDFRAHGESEGAFTTIGLDEVRDVEAALAHVAARPEAADRPVALLGLSMGAATAINAASSLGGVDAVVADSSFATLQNVASNSITHFTDLPKYPFGPLAVVFAAWMVDRDVAENAPVRAVAGVQAPLLLIQGGRDAIAFAEEDGEALRRAAEDAAYWLVPDAAHVAAHRVAQAEYEARVVAFLDEAATAAG